MTFDDNQRRREIDEEVDAHLRARTEYLIARGVPPDAARAEAERRFGDLARARRALYAQAVTTRRRQAVSEHLRQWRDDIRYVARGLTRKPAFSLGVIAIFALGLGINAAVFRVAYDLLLRPPSGVSNAADLRRVEALVEMGSGAPTRATLFSYPDAHALVTSGVFDHAAMYTNPRTGTTSTGRDVSIAEVDGGFFRLLGVQVAEGRSFTNEEVRPGAEIPVAVLSHHLWRQLSGTSPLTPGTTLSIGTHRYDIVGILPRGFAGIDIDPVDVWLPLGAAVRGRGEQNGVPFAWYQTEMLRVLRVIGRRPARMHDAALAEGLTTVLAGARSTMMQFPRTADPRPIVPVGDATQTGASRQLVQRLSLVALLVLVIAGANAMNLILAHSLHRQQEVVVRLALGAGRRRVIRLLVTQSLLLAGAGGAIAMVVGHWTAQGLWRAMFPDGRSVPASIDPLTLGVTALLAVLVGLAAGLPAAWQTTRPDLTGALRASRSLGHRQTRVTRAALVIGQTALSLTLIVMAGLLVLSLLKLGDIRLGFDPRGLVTASVATPAGTAPKIDMVAVASGLPADQVALATVAPFGATAIRSIFVPGSTFDPEPFEGARYSYVSPNFFAVMGTRLLEGRSLSTADTAGSDPVVVINETMKRNYWGASLPPGACIVIEGCARVIGVVEDIRDTPGASAPMRYYLPLAQAGTPASVLVVRTEPAAVPAVTAHVRKAVPAGERLTFTVVSDQVTRALRPWTTAMVLFLVLGVVGLTLASVGLYSVMSYLASERTPEFGLRMVLGATHADVARLVLRDGARLVAWGSIAGLVLAALSARYLGSLLFDVSPFDGRVYVVGLISLAAAAGVAMWSPARRAATVSPAVALRVDG